MKKISFRNNSFAVGAFSLTLAALLTKVLGVLYKIPLSYILTDEGMGYFNSAYTVYGFFYILSTAGVPKAVTMVTTELHSQDMKGDTYSFFKYVLSRFFIIGAIVSLIFAVFSPLFCSIIGTAKSLYTMLVIAPTILFVTMSGVIRGNLNSYSTLMPIAISQLIEAVSKLVLGIIFAHIGVKLNISLPLISAFTVFGITLGSLFSTLYLMFASKSNKQNNRTGQNISIDKKKNLIKLFKIAIPITLSSSVLSVTGIIDTGIIIRGLSYRGCNEASAISAYGNYTTLAFPMLNLVSSVMAPICVAYLPKLREHFVKGNDSEFHKVLSRPFFIVSYFCAPCAFAYFFYAFDLLDILFASSASAFGAEMLVYLSPAVFLLPVLSVVNTALEARGRLNATVISLSAGSLIKLVLSFFLITTTNLGILSGPISTCVSYLLSLLISVYALKRAQIKIRTVLYLFMPLCLGLAVFYSVYSMVYLNYELLSPFFRCSISVGLSFVCYFFVVLIAFKLRFRRKNK